MKKIVFLVGISLLTIACSNDDNNSGNDVDFEPLDGEVQGVNFVAKGGYAFYRTEESISVDITNVTAGCESDLLTYEIAVSFEVPAEKGVYNDINVVFLKKGETPYNALNSTVIVDEITSSSISVRVDSDAVDNINDIDGAATISICK